MADGVETLYLFSKLVQNLQEFLKGLFHTRFSTQTSLNESTIGLKKLEVVVTSLKHVGKILNMSQVKLGQFQTTSKALQIVSRLNEVWKNLQESEMPESVLIS